MSLPMEQFMETEVAYYVYCESTYPSMIFATTLKAKGYDNLINIQGGFKAIKKKGKFNRLMINISLHDALYHMY
jgi:rhodanese-related sulfurtransferase